MIKKRVLMDLTMTARWCRAGVMVGIVRVACEMYKSLQKMTEVHMVQLEKKNLTDTTARVALVMDITGSMYMAYKNGVVQEIVNKILPLAVGI